MSHRGVRRCFHSLKDRAPLMIEATSTLRGESGLLVELHRVLRRIDGMGGSRVAVGLP